MRSSRPSFPAASAWPRPPVPASPSSPPTPVPRARTATSTSPRRFSTMNKPDPRKALGKGIDALMRGRPTALQSPTTPLEAKADEPPQYLPVEQIDANPFQPRRVFEEERLQELAQSIRANGIIQPLVVRKIGDRYQLVAGERRFRASKIAGLQSLPVVIREIPDDRL